MSHASRTLRPTHARPVMPRTRADLNVTPLIDVLLVLLVIFMAALPIAQRGTDVQLPEPSPRMEGEVASTQIVLEIGADRSLAVNSTPVSAEDLGARLRSIFSSRRDKTLFLIGAGTLRYGDIVQVIDTARGAGITRVGIVTKG